MNMNFDEINVDRKSKTSRTAYLGLLLAIAIILGYVEAVIPFNLGIPGVKIGIANIVTVFVLYISGKVGCFMIGLLRILIIGFMFGNISSIIYSLSGFVLAYTAMIILKKIKLFSVFTVSMMGAVFHNIGQLITAVFVTGTAAIFYYLPVLIISGLICGLVTGYIANIILKHVYFKNKKS